MNERRSLATALPRKRFYLHTYVYISSTDPFVAPALSLLGRQISFLYSFTFTTFCNIGRSLLCRSDIQRHQRYQFVQGQANRLRQRANIIYQSFAHIRGRETAQKVEKQQKNKMMKNLRS